MYKVPARQGLLQNQAAAHRYVDYLLDALKRRELFSWLHLTPQTFWHVLVLRDRYNYLGLVAPVTEALKQQLSQHPGLLTQVGHAQAGATVVQLCLDSVADASHAGGYWHGAAVAAAGA